MKSITLHLVVAEATYFNQLDRFQGWSGTPLTATGEQATAKVAQQLAVSYTHLTLPTTERV